ncbi:MAG: LysM domain-containing protein [Actinomycetota bacterium]|nr:LysM domain-containing protein [Actinomycetota bacterium]
MSDDPPGELLALIESRKQPPRPLEPEAARGGSTNRRLPGHRVSIELRAALAGLLAALMILTFLLIRLDPAGSSNAGELSAASAKTLPTFWVVGGGQTLGLIAARTGLSTAALEDLNPYVDPGALQVGERLMLRPVKPGAADAAAAARIPAFWVLQKGQTFSLIAARTGLSVAQIESLNPHISLADLQIGERIKLHAAASKSATSANAGKAH